LTALIDRLVVSGVHAIAPLGSTGELAYLDENEFDAVVDTTIAAVDGRVPLVVGVSDLTTTRTARRAQHAQHAGADAVMVLPVSYWKLSEREIFQHFLSIGDAIGISIMMYTNPATSGVDMSPELLVRMFDTIDNVSMVKESIGDLSGYSASTSSAGAGCRSTTAVIRWCWTRCGQVPPGGARPRRVCAHSPASTCTMQYAHANCQQRKLFTPSSSPCWSSSWQAGRPPRSRQGWS
jgi:dihydrodipicolinate synthase/N-acetylneuraminate lyase